MKYAILLFGVFFLIGCARYATKQELAIVQDDVETVRACESSRSGYEIIKTNCMYGLTVEAYLVLEDDLNRPATNEDAIERRTLYCYTGCLWEGACKEKSTPVCDYANLEVRRKANGDVYVVGKTEEQRE